ncbi:ABC transporter ATP-binding protein [Microbacterium testaceum]|uniref:ABC transporter ATP-binding protein n=1 Tax=Microbacterium testaceum TaxID=2033 RepID=UPI000AF36E34|nr:ABC transporter ATP-binding protein [Microbacterium testaceum]
MSTPEPAGIGFVAHEDVENRPAENRPAENSSAGLELAGLSRRFGGVYANRDISFRVAPGELRGVIGPNGAGKSTLFGLISGHVRAQEGVIRLDGERIDRLPPHRRARRGVAIVFQGARLFPGMTVLENVAVGAHARTRSGALDAAVRSPRHRREEREIRADAEEALARVGLADWAGRGAEQLPLGQQRRLQVARALTARPRVLLLDEPASGLRADERDDLRGLIRELHDDGTTILLIEHDVAMVTALADRIAVLDLGRLIADGTPEEIRRDPAVIAAYLGSEAAA